MIQYVLLVIFFVCGCNANLAEVDTDGIATRNAITDKIGKLLECVKDELDILNDFTFPGPLVIKDVLELSNIFTKNLVKFNHDITGKTNITGGLNYDIIIKLDWKNFAVGTEYKLAMPSFPLKGVGSIKLNVDNLKLSVFLKVKVSGFKIKELRITKEDGTITVPTLVHNGIDMTKTHGPDIVDIIEYFLSGIDFAGIISNVVKDAPIFMPQMRAISDIDLKRCIDIIGI